MKTPLDRLRALADMVRDAELAKLRRLQDTRHSVERAQADLRLAQRDVDAGDDVDPACLAASRGPWLAWAEQRNQALSLQGARAAADAEIQIVAARKALGRAQVLEKLAQAARKPVK
jgi:hypothetical protein